MHNFEETGTPFSRAEFGAIEDEMLSEDGSLLPIDLPAIMEGERDIPSRDVIYTEKDGKTERDFEDEED